MLSTRRLSTASDASAENASRSEVRGQRSGVRGSEGVRGESTERGDGVRE